MFRSNLARYPDPRNRKYQVDPRSANACALIWSRRRIRESEMDLGLKGQIAVVTRVPAKNFVTMVISLTRMTCVASQP